MSNQGLSVPGTSVYASDSMYVGDGTWDSQRNTFLLPNLQGLNFETMRYNGMGNRFRNMVGYKAMITAHGILAAVTFLFVIPAAILMARFYHRNPRTALRFHIWLQVLAVLLSTAAIVLAFQAVGRERSLSNPHHGIGVALYTLVMVQAFGGSVIHRLEKGKERFKIPLKLMIHQWLGRVIALLGIVQVPLGLTLFGSPLVLFILYAVWAFLLLILYFVLSYRNQPEMGFDDHTTYITDGTATSIRSRSRVSRRSRGTGIGALATAGAAGAGLAALRSRSRSRSRGRHDGQQTTVLSSRRDSRSRINDSRLTESEFTDSYLSDEKYRGNQRKGSTWKDRILGAGAAAGGIFAVKSLFNRKKKHPPTETGSTVSYDRPLGPSEVTQTDLSRLEEGRAPESPANSRDDWRRVEEREAAQAAAMAGSPLRKGHRPARSGTSMDSFDSRTSYSDDVDARPRPQSYGLKEGVATLGVLGFLKHSFSKRSKKKEEEHIEEIRQHDLEEERIARKNSQRRRYGDRRGHRPASTILSDSDVTGVTPSVVRPKIPPPPMPPPSSTIIPTKPGDNHGMLSDSDSGLYSPPAGRKQRRRTEAGAAALAAGASNGSPSKRDHSQRRDSREESVVSPPVSVKVKMHNDGRHVTLRRLNEEEAAAEREARKKERQRKNRTGSESSIGNYDNERWRRTEAREAAQAAEMGQIPPPPPMPGTAAAGSAQMPEPFASPPPGPPPMGRPAPSHIPLPPPPPMPAAQASVLSSPMGTHVQGTETDLSNYDSNRRRRRAERAQAKQARLGGSRVEFS
ncbi:hypothetical protein NX059_005144 [Plenodomus lindquistii]|nr:hypothetical protein NX059_005144 [Plenodomus lindquistii]